MLSKESFNRRFFCRDFLLPWLLLSVLLSVTACVPPAVQTTQLNSTTTALNSDNTDINYTGAPDWTQCGSCPPPGPDSQGGDIVSHIP